ncbi:MAG: T9SS type A sorting domain-containing protein [Bacteroidales bacterium]|nr:T9SS type A sorting domain-containing protein [Bacteroidales bacterium]MCF8402495.1 T9SS type A sorting domain-containing protein [Bacteroidales bacterium]
MKKINCIINVVLVYIFLISTNLFAQQQNIPIGLDDLPLLSKEDSAGLANLPILTMPEWMQGSNAKTLPEWVDNSTEIYWRPVFAQEQYECGQASGIGLGFAYEINRMRDVAGTEPENQYATHFTWNFGNGGNGWYGVSYFHSFEIVKWEGTPNVEVYGGMTAGGPDRWLSGYDNYYHLMHNRISEVYQIQLSTEEGINTLKNWIHNHLEGADDGGVANFYTNAPGGMPTLPAGTPEAGKYVVTGWTSANHGLTICGYHDSIRWDYNNDGQYTNNIDLNNDGIITPRDWEIGGLKFANTYSGGPSFGNNGFCYMMYKSCADPYGGGGIWNNAAHVLYAKTNVEPQLTAKFTLTYDCRDRIRIQMGMSTNENANSPDYVLGFPMFNFQAGCNYMQGGTLPENKTIEIGLDITPFLNMMDPGTPARYFLLVQEQDPEGWGNGEVNSFSVIDYTNGIEEVLSDQFNVPIVADGLTKLWVNHSVSYDPVFITNDTIPKATVYEPYSLQLEADGGTAPYLWDFDMNFVETPFTQPFPMVTQEQLSPSNANTGYVTKQLGFTFPFYGQDFDEVRVHVDGYITFEDFLTWPYQIYDFLKWAKNKYISPFQADLRLYADDNMWYQGDENSATFRWHTSVNGYENTSELNFAVQLFKNGDIAFYYGDVNDYPEMEWLSGIASGNTKFYQFSEVHNDENIPSSLKLDFEANQYPKGFTVSRYGEFAGTATETYDDLEVRFLVTDENNISSSKKLLFSTDGSNYLVVKNFIVNSGDDDVIEFGETVNLTVQIESLGLVNIYGAQMAINCTDEFLSLIDSTEVLGDFSPGEIKEFTSAFTFDVSNFVPDEHSIDLNTFIEDSSGDDWSSHIYLTAFAPEINALNLEVVDGENGGLDPGETADIIITLFNSGGADAYEILAELTSSDPYIVINNSSALLPEINPGSTGEVVFNVTASDEVPVGYVLEFDLNIQANNDYNNLDQVYIICGLLNEGFETANFVAYPWLFGGDAEWIIDDIELWEGSYSAKSGDIEDNETSSMELELYVLGTGEISFYKKVSSEANYDYLHFYIDGVDMDSWAGEQDWTQQSYPVGQGIHTFKWAFEKDYSVSNGSDCAWIDYILFPPFGDTDPQLLLDPESILVTLNENTMAYDTVHILNEGSGPLFYTMEIVDTTGNPVEWLSIESSFGGLNPGGQDDIAIGFDASQLEAGLYNAEIIITDHMENEYLVVCWLYLDLATGISEQNHDIFIGNNPNPFDQTTSIWFEQNEPSTVTLEVYNYYGKKVKTILSSEIMNPGKHNVVWNATTDAGVRVSNGIYFYRIKMNEKSFTGKMILMD